MYFLCYCQDYFHPTDEFHILWNLRTSRLSTLLTKNYSSPLHCYCYYYFLLYCCSVYVFQTKKNRSSFEQVAVFLFKTLLYSSLSTSHHVVLICTPETITSQVYSNENLCTLTKFGYGIVNSLMLTLDSLCTIQREWACVCVNDSTNEWMNECQ
jgi:hypothetical protein